MSKLLEVNSSWIPKLVLPEVQKDIALICCWFGRTQDERYKAAQEGAAKLQCLSPRAAVSVLVEASKSTEADKPLFQWRGDHILPIVEDRNYDIWQKELMWNMGAEHVKKKYPEVTKLLFVDLDTYPVAGEEDWLALISESLNTYDVMQPWTVVSETVGEEKWISFSAQLKYGIKSCTSGQGFAIAMTMDWFQRCGGWPAESIGGSGDVIALCRWDRSGRHIDIFNSYPRMKKLIEDYTGPKTEYGHCATELLHAWHGKRTGEESNRLFVMRHLVWELCGGYEKVLERSPNGLWAWKEEAPGKLTPLARCTREVIKRSPKTKAETVAIWNSSTGVDRVEPGTITIEKEVAPVNLTVVTVCRCSDRYTPDVVKWFYAQVEEKLRTPHTFMCLTDRPDQVPGGIALQHDWPGWWAKLELFRPGLFQDGRTVLFFDLDTVLVNSFNAPEPPKQGEILMLKFPPSWWSRCGSGVMYWKSPLTTPYDVFIKNPKEAREYFSGDQEVISSILYSHGIRIREMPGAEIQFMNGTEAVPVNKPIGPIWCAAGSGKKPFEMNLPWIPRMRPSNTESPKDSVAELTVITIYKENSGYDPKHVKWLRRQVADKIRNPHRFICLTDTSNQVPGEMHLKHDWSGDMSRIELFRQGLMGPSDTILFLDLNTVLPRTFEIGPIEESVLYLLPTENALSSHIMLWKGSASSIYERVKDADKQDIHDLYESADDAITGLAAQGNEITLRDISSILSVQCMKDQDEEADICCWLDGRRPWDLPLDWIPRLEMPAVVDDIALIVCWYGEDKEKLAAAREGVTYYNALNPLPARMILVEASPTEETNFPGWTGERVWVKTGDEHSGIFHKEDLFNIGTRHLLKEQGSITKLLFTDMDTRPSIGEEDWMLVTSSVLNRCSLVHPWEVVKESKGDENWKSYSFQAATGRRNITCGQGFSVAMTTDWYKQAGGWPKGCMAMDAISVLQWESEMIHSRDWYNGSEEAQRLVTSYHGPKTKYGCCPGTLIHQFHGYRKGSADNRRYQINFKFWDWCGGWKRVCEYGPDGMMRWLPTAYAQAGKRTVARFSEAKTFEEYQSIWEYEKAELNHVFDGVYRSELWGEGSGPGSTPETTRPLIPQLSSLFEERGAKKLLDIGCGMSNWMRQAVPKSVEEYIGLDVSSIVIEANRRLSPLPGWEFKEENVVAGLSTYPNVDLVFCRDVLTHLPNGMVKAALANIVKVCPLLLTTTWIDGANYPEILPGEWRKLNLQKPPFNLPSPILLIDEVEDAAKKMALFDLSKWNAGEVKTSNKTEEVVVNPFFLPNGKKVGSVIGLITCAEKDPWLQLTIERARQEFSQFVVITSKTDVDAQEQAKKNGAEVIVVETSEGGKFSIEDAMNTCLNSFPKDAWVVLLDSDIIIQRGWVKRLSEMTLSRDRLYYAECVIPQVRGKIEVEKLAQRVLEEGSWPKFLEEEKTPTYSQRLPDGCCQIFSLEKSVGASKEKRYPCDSEEKKGNRRIFSARWYGLDKCACLQGSDMALLRLHYSP